LVLIALYFAVNEQSIHSLSSLSTWTIVLSPFAEYTIRDNTWAFRVNIYHIHNSNLQRQFQINTTKKCIIIVLFALCVCPTSPVFVVCELYEFCT